MALDDFNKTKLEIALAGGTAAGTSSFIDTSGYTQMYLYTIGTTGSATANVWVNSGTTKWNGTDLSAQMVRAGSHIAAGTGYDKVTNLSGLTDQAVITHATINGTYTTSFVLHD